MFSNIVLPLLALSAIYAFAILCCWALLGLLRVSAERRIFLSFLVFGTATGFLVALEWPQDSIYLYNFPAQFLGYEVYQRSIQLIGDPTADNAHATIPWFLRIPEVFVPVAILFWGLLGALVQYLVNRSRPVPATSRS